MAESIGKTAPFSGHTGGVLTVAYSPDGTMLATGASDGSVRIWDTRSGKVLRLLSSHWDTHIREVLRLLSGHTGGVNTVAYSPDGKMLGMFSGHAGWVNAMAYSPDGAMLATTSGGGHHAVRIWDARSGEVLRMLSGHVGSVHAVS